jgi:hypothetical protein
MGFGKIIIFAVAIVLMIFYPPLRWMSLFLFLIFIPVVITELRKPKIPPQKTS